MLFKFGARPYGYVANPEIAGRLRYLIAALRRDGAAADESESVRCARGCCNGIGHIVFGLRLGQAFAVYALNNGAPVLPLVKWLNTDNVAALIAPGLPIPSQRGPADAKMIGKHQPLEVAAAEIFKMNWPHRNIRHQKG